MAVPTHKRRYVATRLSETTSVLTEAGPVYVEKGEGVHALTMQACAFYRMLESDAARACLVDNQPLAVPLPCPDADMLQQWWNGVSDNLFGPTPIAHERRRAIGILIRHQGWKDECRDLRNILTVGEADVTEALVEHYRDKTVAASTINKTISSMRRFFFFVGRAHRMCDGQDLQLYAKTIAYSGNPVGFISSVIQDSARVKPAASVDVDDETESERKGAPVSLALAYHAILFLFLKGHRTMLMGTTRDVRRIINVWLTALLLLFCVHDVSRPVEVYGNLHHRNLYTYEHVGVDDEHSAAKKRYLLALAFVKPETLEFLIRNDLLPHKYVFESWKGKKLNVRSNRVKTSMTPSTNGIDLVFWYAVIMRLVIVCRTFSVDPVHFDGPLFHADNVFYKGTGLSSPFDEIAPASDSSWLDHLQQHFCKKVGMNAFTFYSLRYAHAEEMSKGRIQDAVRRRIMGHSETSNQNMVYANNKDARPFLSTK